MNSYVPMGWGDKANVSGNVPVNRFPVKSAVCSLSIWKNSCGRVPTISFLAALNTSSLFIWPISVGRAPLNRQSLKNTEVRSVSSPISLGIVPDIRALESISNIFSSVSCPISVDKVPLRLLSKILRSVSLVDLYIEDGIDPRSWFPHMVRRRRVGCAPHSGRVPPNKLSLSISLSRLVSSDKPDGMGPPINVSEMRSCSSFRRFERLSGIVPVSKI